MAGEKYIVATAENPVQIAVRNTLNSYGYIFLGNCCDSISLLRLVRSYHPDFIIADLNINLRDLRTTLETIDDELLCASVIIGEHKDMETTNLIEKSQTMLFCLKPINRDVFINTVEIANMIFKRIFGIDKKLKDMTSNYETRKVVERAKWILIERDGISETEAYEKMRKKSMDNRMSMKSIAEAIIFTYEISGKQK